MSGIKICNEKKVQKSRTCSNIRKLSMSEITITALQLQHFWCQTLKILGTWSLLHRTYVCPQTIIKKFYMLAATGDQLLLWSRKVSMFCIVTILLFCIPKTYTCSSLNIQNLQTLSHSTGATLTSEDCITIILVQPIAEE